MREPLIQSPVPPLTHTISPDLQKAMALQQQRAWEVSQLLHTAQPDLSAIWAIRAAKALEVAKALQGFTGRFS